MASWIKLFNCGAIASHNAKKAKFHNRSGKLLLTTAMLLTTSALVPAEAANRDYTARFQTTLKGKAVLFGNAALTCNTSIGGGAAQCTAARNQSGSALNNNSHYMDYVDIDTDPTTFNSSSATYNFPVASNKIVWAGLYWGGDTADATVAPQTKRVDISKNNQIKLKHSTDGSYTTFTAQTIDTATGAANRFSAFADVTAFVKARGSGTYTGADIQTGRGADKFGGWTLVVVYEDPAEVLRSINIYDGYQSVGSGATVTATISGFLTPLSGLFETAIGAISYEGDYGTSGDSFELDGDGNPAIQNFKFVGDTANPNNNFFNSTNTILGTRITGTTSPSSRNPDYPNLLGMDMDFVNAVNNGSPIMQNGITSADLRFKSTGDVYYPTTFLFSVQVFQPVLTANFKKTVTDLDGGNIAAGDELKYTISYSNTGNDAATDVVLTDAIPANATYVPGSLEVRKDPGIASPPVIMSDAADSDRAEYDSANNRVVFRLGTGATGTKGGKIAVDDEVTIEFRVTVNANAAGTTISNQAKLDYMGERSGKSFSGVSDNPATSGSSDPTNVSVAINPTPGEPFQCDGRFYQIRIDGSNSKLFAINRRVSPYQQTELVNANNPSPVVLNGLGFNSQDGYLYALYRGPDSSTLTGSSAARALYIIGQSDAVNVGNINGFPIGFVPTAADFDNAGNYYVTRAGNGHRDLYKINVATRTATYIELSTITPNLGDMSYNPKDNTLYGISGTNLYIINPISGSVTTRPITGVTTAGSWGTTFIDTSGTFYAYDNAGYFYTIDLTTGSAALLSSAPSTSVSDGAICAFPKEKLDVIKAVETATEVPSTTLPTYDIPYSVVLRNTGPQSTPNVQITENLNLTFRDGTPTIAIQTAPTVTGGALSLNPSFDGITNFRLLSGSDALFPGETRTIKFTVRLTYPSEASVPVPPQNNNVYASSSSVGNNPGHTFVGTDDRPIPPSDLLSADASTNGTTPPVTANGDTPSPTPISLPPKASDPNILLSKRITAVTANGVNTSFSTVFDPDSIPSDPSAAHPMWPTNYLQGGGVVDDGTIPDDPVDNISLKPKDEIEYTIYFLNSGGKTARNPLICDRVPQNMAFIPNAFNTTPPAPGGTFAGGIPMGDRGIVVNVAGVGQAHSNINDGDAAQYFPPGEDPRTVYPGINCGGVNTDGAVVVRLNDIPKATSAGNPTNSFGYIRFRARLK